MTGQEFKSLRKSAGLTQQALGDMAGTSRRAIAKYEAGEIDLGQIEVKTAIRLAVVTTPGARSRAIRQAAVA